MADAVRPRPIEDVHEISAITYGFMGSKALFSACPIEVEARMNGRKGELNASRNAPSRVFSEPSSESDSPKRCANRPAASARA